MILKIITIPNPILKKLSEPITEITQEIQSFVSDLIETMKSYKNCIGLAAPQVGRSLQIAVIDVSLYPKPFNNHGQIILLNPEIIKAEGTRTGREGCLSVPDFTGNVSRKQNISVKYLDLAGNPVILETDDFEATVLQHEIDHLNGIVFLDRVTSLKTDVFRRKSGIDNKDKKE
ncbi:MAG: peptide deformylase [Elusimicrobia bacterium]|nr:peptide deformylase [Candidatus Liberimonas magnetica]